jgi:hypothetical protein
MKKLIYIVFGIGLALASCKVNKNAHVQKLKPHDEHGYKANSTNQVIDENAKTKKNRLNKSEHQRKVINNKAEEKAAHSGKAKKHHGHFKHYMH